MTSQISRREALRHVAMLMGGAISAPAILGVLNGCTPKQELNWKPVFLTEEQAQVVSAVADIIIPRTDTPGALDVGAPAFIDKMLKDCYDADDQKRYSTGLAQLQEQGLLKKKPAERVTLVQSVHDAALAAEKESDVPSSERQRPFILMTKELTLLSFFTSEPGATQILQYTQAPGGYRACVPRAQAGNGKSWASEQSRRF